MSFKRGDSCFLALAPARSVAPAAATVLATGSPNPYLPTPALFFFLVSFPVPGPSFPPAEPEGGLAVAPVGLFGLFELLGV